MSKIERLRAICMHTYTRRYCSLTVARSDYRDFDLDEAVTGKKLDEKKKLGRYYHARVPVAIIAFRVAYLGQEALFS